MAGNKPLTNSLDDPCNNVPVAGAEEEVMIAYSNSLAPLAAQLMVAPELVMLLMVRLSGAAQNGLSNSAIGGAALFPLSSLLLTAAEKLPAMVWANPKEKERRAFAAAVKTRCHPSLWKLPVNDKKIKKRIAPYILIRSLFCRPAVLCQAVR